MKLAIILLASAQLLLMVSAQDNLETHCKNKFKNIDTVEQMVELAKELGNYRSGPGEQKVEKKLERCLNEYDSIKELAELLQYKGDVCHPDHVANMLQYHRNYVLGSQNSGVQRILKKNKRMTRFFFRRYAFHVAFMCRQNALKNLREASTGFESEEWLQVLSWRNNSSPANESDASIQQAATGLIEYINTFDKLSKVMSIGRNEFSAAPRTSMSPKEQKMQETLEIKIPDVEKVRSTISTCDKFAVYYEGQILSVVRLANVGYRWYGHKLNENNETSDEDRRLLGDWIKVAQVCFSIRKYKDSLDIESAPLAYHDFENNHLGPKEDLASREEIKDKAMSKYDFEASEISRKLLRSEGRLMGLLAKKFSNNSKIAAILKDYQEQLEHESGDRVSKEIKKDPAEKYFLVLLVVVILAAFVAWGVHAMG